MAAGISPQADAFLTDYFAREILPALTPIALDQSHPFPSPREESFQLAIRFRPVPGRRARYGVVLIHPTLPRFIHVRDEGAEKVLSLEQVIVRHLHELFPHAVIEDCWVVRVNRLELGTDDAHPGEVDEYDVSHVVEAHPGGLQHAA